MRNEESQGTNDWLSGPAATGFELFAASAGTRFIAPDLGEVALDGKFDPGSLGTSRFLARLCWAGSARFAGHLAVLQVLRHAAKEILKGLEVCGAAEKII